MSAPSARDQLDAVLYDEKLEDRLQKWLVEYKRREDVLIQETFDKPAKDGLPPKRRESDGPFDGRGFINLLASEILEKLDAPSPVTIDDLHRSFSPLLFCDEFTTAFQAAIGNCHVGVTPGRIAWGGRPLGVADLDFADSLRGENIWSNRVGTSIEIWGTGPGEPESQEDDPVVLYVRLHGAAKSKNQSISLPSFEARWLPVGAQSSGSKKSRRRKSYGAIETITPMLARCC